MVSCLTHPAAPLVIACWAPPLRRPSLLLAGALLAMAPDLDTIGYWAGVPYEAECGHRGLSHSLAFAVLVGMVLGPPLAAWLALPARRVAAFLAAASASHGLLDMLTDGGLGVALLWPFSAERLFWPWRPIAVSPIGIAAFFSERGCTVLASEALWVWLPALLLGGLGRWCTGPRRRGEPLGDGAASDAQAHARVRGRRP